MGKGRYRETLVLLIAVIFFESFCNVFWLVVRSPRFSDSTQTECRANGLITICREFWTGNSFSFRTRLHSGNMLLFLEEFTIVLFKDVDALSKNITSFEILEPHLVSFRIWRKKSIDKYSSKKTGDF